MPRLSYKIIKSALKCFYFPFFSCFQSLFDCGITFVLYQKHMSTEAHVSRSRWIHYQKPDSMLSFSIL